MCSVGADAREARYGAVYGAFASRSPLSRASHPSVGARRSARPKSLGKRDLRWPAAGSWRRTRVGRNLPGRRCRGGTGCGGRLHPRYNSSRLRGRGYASGWGCSSYAAVCIACKPDAMCEVRHLHRASPSGEGTDAVPVCLSWLHAGRGDRDDPSARVRDPIAASVARGEVCRLCLVLVLRRLTDRRRKRSVRAAANARRASLTRWSRPLRRESGRDRRALQP